jgi:hypothetical protein
MRNYFRENINGVDATIDSIGYIDNKLPICNFFDNVILNKPDSINILFHSWEGEPLLRTITYDGQRISLIVYSDPLNKEIIQTFSGDSYKKEKNDILIEYNLYDKGNFVVRLVFYRN